MKREYALVTPARAHARKRGKTEAAAMIQAAFKGYKKRKGAYASKYFEKGSKYPESKYITTALNYLVDDSTAPTILLLNGLSQGTGQTQRVGQKVRGVSLQYNLVLSNSSAKLASWQAANSFGQMIRVAIVHDRMAGQSMPPIGDVWELNAVNIDPLAVRNEQFIERYSVLSDELLTLDQIANGTITCDRFIKLGLETHYTGTGNAIANIASGTLGVYIYSNAQSATGNLPIVRGFIRYKYTDE